MGLYGEYALVFGVATAGTYLFAFPVRRLAIRFGAVDRPDSLRLHAGPIPTIGGAAMFLGFATAMVVASQLGALGPVFRGSSEPLGVVLAALVIYVVGLVDDIRDISPPAKVAGQVLAAMVLLFLGVTMYYFKIPFVPTIFVLSPSILPLVTAVWVVVMANAVNLIDGLDGLAAGIIAIAAGTLCIYGLRLEVLGNLSADNLGPLVAAITCGVCIGFLPHNFHPARVFMGDGGALFLGLLMAAATMVIGGRTTANGTAATDVTGLTFFRFAPLFIPIFILGVPLLDTAFAIVRRTVRGSSFAERDLGHLHHRLVRLGHGHRRAVLILWAWTAVFSIFVLLVTFGLRFNAFVPFVAVFLVAVLYTVFRPGAGLPTPLAAADSSPDEATEDVPAGVPGKQPISVVMSTAAGVAVAGERDLASPKRRRRRVARRVRRERGPKTAGHEESGAAAPPARFTRPGDEMGG
ncbi:MAG TPA: MraY family glycosyltransferase [Acidimicrobiales bacterium]|nr:MraY family glycosyltransferase [Acidimicrobiales bacterium]